MVRKLAIILIFLFSQNTLTQTKSSSDIFVKGSSHNGPYLRTPPDKTVNNNFSTRGNINPYTGKRGTKPREYKSSIDTNNTDLGYDEANALKKIICPPLNYYNLTPGYRLAGISPSCQATQISFREIDEGLKDKNKESQQYQFTYGRPKDTH